MKQQSNQDELISRGVETVVVREELLQRLRQQSPLRVKLGVDPTSPRLHLGHAVVLRKLRQFQERGHQAIFLVGDFTARIGDPTDKSSARQPMTADEIAKNLETYIDQAGKILDLSKTEIRHNSEWLDHMDFTELFNVMSRFTVNQMLERDMFQERLKKKKPLWVHELMYPIMQGYDSVALRADVELGGTDQTFNMLTARTLQPYYHQPEQDIMTVPLIEGTDGSVKMSKSVGNTIDLLDAPTDMYGKVMSIPDSLIIKYFTLLTDVALAEIKEHDQAMKAGANPRDYKARLASALVTTFHGQVAATEAAKGFDRQFKEKKSPQDMPTFPLKRAGSFSLIDIIVDAKLATSRGEARRLIEQGAVRYDGQVVSDWQEKVTLKNGAVLQVGKRKFLKFIK